MKHSQTQGFFTSCLPSLSPQPRWPPPHRLSPQPRWLPPHRLSPQPRWPPPHHLSPQPRWPPPHRFSPQSRWPPPEASAKMAALSPPEPSARMAAATQIPVLFLDLFLSLDLILPQELFMFLDLFLPQELYLSPSLYLNLFPSPHLHCGPLVHQLHRAPSSLRLCLGRSSACPRLVPSSLWLLWAPASPWSAVALAPRTCRRPGRSRCTWILACTSVARAVRIAMSLGILIIALARRLSGSIQVSTSTCSASVSALAACTA
ncbi:hypothetical protein PO909_033801 [Leuciscus waleckii]